MRVAALFVTGLTSLPLLVQADLRSRLSAASITALFPGDSGFAAADSPFNRRFDNAGAPAAIAMVTSTEQVADAVMAGAAEGVAVIAKSGGHSYMANSLIPGALIIDLSNLKSISVDSTSGLATIETGNRIGDIALALDSQGGRALPHGTCPYVGLGGHVSFGGRGFTSRMWGLTLDTIESSTAVLANGSIVTVFASPDPDLFFALRGSAPSFAIQTSITFRTFPSPSTVTSFSYIWTHANASLTTQAILAWQDFSLNFSIPDAFGGNLDISPGSTEGTVRLTMHGAWYDDVDKLAEIVAPFLTMMPAPDTSSNTTGSWIQSLEKVANGQNLNTSGVNLSSDHDTFYAKSLTTPLAVPFGNASASALAGVLTSGSNTSWFVQMELYGGSTYNAFSSPSPSSTAFFRRDQLFTIQFYASSSNFAPPYPDVGFTFLDGMVNALVQNMPSDWDYGAYPNYIDDRLDNWQRLYYGSNFDRLTQIKSTYDPANVFRFPQSIPGANATNLTINH